MKNTNIDEVNKKYKIPKEKLMQHGSTVYLREKIINPGDWANYKESFILLQTRYKLGLKVPLEGILAKESAANDRILPLAFTRYCYHLTFPFYDLLCHFQMNDLKYSKLCNSKEQKKYKKTYSSYIFKKIDKTLLANINKKAKTCQRILNESYKKGITYCDEDKDYQERPDNTQCSDDIRINIYEKIAQLEELVLDFRSEYFEEDEYPSMKEMIDTWVPIFLKKGWWPVQFKYNNGIYTDCELEGFLYFGRD